MERAFTKHQILALYLNEIYLGYGSYGVAAAALNYFDKALDQLELHEMAYLAALPKVSIKLSPCAADESSHRAAELGSGADEGKWLCFR